jgi:hypothetical protein
MNSGEDAGYCLSTPLSPKILQSSRFQQGFLQNDTGVMKEMKNPLNLPLLKRETGIVGPDYVYHIK